jgi:hypothetical protein
MKVSLWKTKTHVANKKQICSFCFISRLLWWIAVLLMAVWIRGEAKGVAV